jgi:ribosomal protein S18 acetylase RimI-like enzyme
VAVEYRPAATADLSELLRFWLAATEVPSSTDDLDGLTTLVTHDPAAIILAVDCGTIVGSLIVAWDGWRGGFYRLAVHPEFRTQGIGRALVRAGEARLVALGCRRINLVAVTEHDKAVGFWRAVGYAAQPQDTRFVRNLVPHGPS